MLRGIRKASANWLGKTIMAAVVGFLIISFGIWGIGDIFRGFGQSTVATIGSTEIGIEQFRQAYNDRLRQVERSLGRGITPTQARAFGLQQQVLGQIVAEAAIDEETRRLKLNISDSEVARLITSDANFRGPTGQFDKIRFDQIIRQAGYNEPRYAQEQRRLSIRRQLSTTIGSEPMVPKAAADASNRYENEQRGIDYVILDRSHIGDIPAPNADVLTKYFNERKVLFRAPEYRKVTTLLLSPKEIARSIQLSDADARRSYEDNKARFSTPERRQVQQIVFKTPEEASEASSRLAKGLSFDALVTERDLKSTDVDLGLVTKSGIIDRAVADAAFALRDGGISAPVNGRFGTTIVRVTKIEPEKIKPFEEASSEIKQALASDRARTDLQSLRDKIEDDRAGGMRLDEIGQKYKLTSRIIEAIDRAGRNPEGSPVADLPAGVDFAGNVFSTDIGVENDAAQLSDGGLLWIDVTGITPSRDRNLDEIKDRVEARWRDDQASERLTTKAKEMVEQIKAGTAMNEVARKAGLKVETTFGMKRNATKPLTANAVAEVFRTPKGSVGYGDGQNANERVIFRVTEVNEPAFDASSQDAKKYFETWRRALAEELLTQYVQRLETDIGTKINQEAVARAFGGDQS